MPRFDHSVSLLVWGYNEEELVQAFFARALRMMEATVVDFEIVFINDGSSDKTGELADAVAAVDKRVRVMHNERNMNVGYSCRRAIGAASKEYLFWQTVDWAYDLRNLRVYLELLKHFDVVQGVRQSVPGRADTLKLIRAIGSRSDNLRKAVISVVNYLLIRLLFGVPFSDYQNVTFYRSRQVRELPLEGRSSFVNPEMLIRTYVTGLSFIEVPIPFMRRATGKAKGTRLSSIARSVREIFAAWWHWGWRLRALVRRDRDRIARSIEPGDLPVEVRKILAEPFEL
jgi:glycosyltransferase involved in cell wall biosynthesis